MIGIAFLLLLSGYFSGSESALFSLPWWRLYQMEQDEGVGRIVVRLLQRPHRLLITILLGNTLVNVAAGALSERAISSRFPEQGIWLAIGVMTLVLLIVGEIGPKTLAMRWPETIAKLNARPLQGLTALLLPVTTCLEWFTQWVNEIFRKNGLAADDTYREDFITLVEEGEHEGILTKEERLIMERMLKMNAVNVKRIMTPRTSIFALPEDTSFIEAVRAFLMSNLRRIPLFRNNLDNIVGILYAKDVLEGWFYPLLRKAPKYLARPPLFVPGCISVEQVYSQLNEKQVHFAVVLDEYGGTAGIVTHEDILNFLFEAVVGSSLDDAAIANEVVLDGMTILEKVDAMLSLGVTKEERESFKTLNGLLVGRWGYVPKPGDKLDMGDWEAEILSSEGTRIGTVALRKKSMGMEK